MFAQLMVLSLCCLGSLEIHAKTIETKYVEDILPLIDEDTTGKRKNRDEAIVDFYPHWIKTQKACRVRTLEGSFVPTVLSLQNKKK